MTTPPPARPVTVDYTSRDFYSLRDDLIARVQSRVPDWKGNDPSDFGVALLEAFAYVGDTVSYYADRVANETNLLTATQRSSVIEIAKSYGYNPSGYQAAALTLQVLNSSKTTDYTIPSGTQFKGTAVVQDTVRQVIFTTSSEVTVVHNTAGTGAALVSATHGELVSLRTTPAALYSSAGELIGYSSGVPNQRFTLAENQVVDGSIFVTVKVGDRYLPWTQVLHITDYGPNDSVYSVDLDENNYVTVIFGDGISGAIPPIHFEIRADYTVGGGSVGNIPINTALSVYAVPPVIPNATIQAIQANITAIAQTAGSGGADPETLDSIRYTAPRAFSSLNRAVTLQDYSSLAVGAPKCVKANAVADIWSSVTVYAAPARSENSSDFYPLFDETNTTLNSIEWVPFQADVVGALSSKTPVGVSVTVSPPKYVPVVADIKYNKLDGYLASQVEADIRAYMETYYNYSAMVFEQVIRPEYIEQVLLDVPGVETVRVNSLYRLSDTAARNTLIGSSNEIFVFNTVSSGTSRTTISSFSSNAGLSTLVINDGTSVIAPSPTFASDFTNYSYSVGTSKTSVTVTPTAAAGALTSIVVTKVGGSSATVASGGTTSVTLGSAGTTTQITVQVLAEDRLSSQTYYLAVHRA
ncbi:Baseplate protein J-like [uncultured Caudovirales phage]|uniref:Baseplate protein J-like n=1 Tax=uncultured Caudovirales phage TaxID=2100421 RepID=A0A6J7WX19_9CAUD|nr:Baseplate protein J-like [uncultured Caudovirales phage]